MIKVINTPNTKKALKFMFEKHKDQLDKSGIPYVFHPFTVAYSMDDEDSTIVALLHDTLEDTNTTVEELVDLGFSNEVIDAIKLLTHEENEDYFDYIRRIKTNPLATKVKLSDLKHNSDLTRLDTVTDKDLQRIEKYKKAREILTQK